MKIAFASDHAGFALKKEIISYVKELGHQVLDFGAYSEDSVDYPEFAFPAAEAVAGGIADYGIVICGTGIGVNITCNKVTGIRAALCTNETMATMAREHNNANILNMGARIIDVETAKKITSAFLDGEFQGGRHMIRIEKIHFLTNN